LLSDVMGSIIAVLVVPGDCLDVVAATERIPIGPVSSTASRVFPFGFGWQSEVGVDIARPLSGYFRQDAAGVELVEESAGAGEGVPRDVFHRLAVAGIARGIAVGAYGMAPQRLGHRHRRDEEVRHFDGSPDFLFSKEERATLGAFYADQF